MLQTRQKNMKMAAVYNKGINQHKLTSNITYRQRVEDDDAMGKKACPTRRAGTEQLHPACICLQ